MSAQTGQRFPDGPLLRVPSDLADSGTRMERVIGVDTARVVFADYDLLQHDFPELGEPRLLPRHPELRTMSAAKRGIAIHDIVDDWLLYHCAFVSEPQAGQSVTNTEIRTDGRTVEAFRPPRYGRAIVTPLRDGVTCAGPRGAGLFDLKGAGVAPFTVPRQLRHSNGLYFLGLAITDLMMQWVIDEIFRRSTPHFWTVPTYAILDLGFDVYFRGKPGQSPAGMQVRRAHRRPLGGQELPVPGSSTELLKFEIEALLRGYGVSSANPFTCYDLSRQDDGTLSIRYGGKRLENVRPDQIAELAKPRTTPLRFEGINIQLTREHQFDPSFAQLVDLSHYVVLETFENPVLSMVTGRPLYWGHVIWPDDPHFIRPNPSLRIPPALWAHWQTWPDIISESEGPLTEMPQAHARGFRMARQFREGQMSRAELYGAMREVVEESIAGWHNP